MASYIKLKRSAVPGKAPAAEDLELGELAINTYDGKLYLKKEAGATSIVSIGERGYTGSTGFVGSQGGIGYTGSQGIQGDMGPIGYTGSQGSIGYTGSQGPQGPIGYTGSAGAAAPKSISIRNPSGSENITMFFTPVQITVSIAEGVLRGSSSPSVTLSIRYSTDRSATGTLLVDEQTLSDTTTGTALTITNTTIPANSFVWLTTSAVSGSVNEMHLTLIF